MNFSKKTIIKLIGITSSWSLLGFYRGILEYNYNNKKEIDDYNIQNERYKKDILKYPEISFTAPIKPTYFYITSFITGLSGLYFYIFPITAPICLVKEIYRLEINLRDIDDEKKTKFYNTIIY